ncbi:MAG: cyclodeaminase/cyclohydrolase family protein [Steroidobacteraceae bacterium]
MLLGMIPDCDRSQVTLEQFRREVASPQPTPAGVAIAAVSASFALGLVVKVLAVTGRRNPPPTDTVSIEPLVAAAEAASQRILQLAANDIAAFEAYLTARRLPRTTESERQARQQALESSLRSAIDVPLAAAQEAAAGVQLCTEVSAFAPPALVADLGVAATLLAGALRSFLLCAQSNVQQLAPEVVSLRERVAAETKRHERALRTAEALLERIRS